MGAELLDRSPPHQQHPAQPFPFLLGFGTYLLLGECSATDTPPRANQSPQTRFLSEVTLARELGTELSNGRSSFFQLSFIPRSRVKDSLYLEIAVLAEERLPLSAPALG